MVGRTKREEYTLATFFVVVHYLESDAELIKRMVEAPEWNIMVRGEDLEIICIL